MDLRQQIHDLLSAGVGFNYKQPWNGDFIDKKEGGLSYLKRNIKNTIDIIGTSLGSDQYCAIVSGFEVGRYTVILRNGNILSCMKSLSTRDARHDLRSWISCGADSHEELCMVKDNKVLIHLICNGELFGFLCFEKASGVIDPHGANDLRFVTPDIILMLAELIFSIRVRSLAEPFESFSRGAEQDALFMEHVAERTAQAFGADGVLFRTYHRVSDTLEVGGHAGTVPEKLLQDASPRSGVEGRVFSAQDADWAAVVPDKSELCRGAKIGNEELGRLEDIGVRAMLTMRLISPISYSESAGGVGTLSYFFLRPHRFSWRDVALFKSFSQRVADSFLLLEQRRELDTNSNIVAVQSKLMTSVELAALISHDLFHKAFNAARTFDQYKKIVHKSYTPKADQKPQSLALLAAEADSELAIRRVHDAVIQLRSVSKSEEEFLAPKLFTIRGVIEEVILTLSGALERQGIKPHINLQPDIKIDGPRQIMLQAVYNLAINTIDAVRLRPRRRSTQLTFHGKLAGRSYDLQVWDDGPGIKQSDFRDPYHDVFEIGRTTKSEGSGMGLPIARTLLHRHFRAELSLQELMPARFLIRIPLPPG